MPYQVEAAINDHEKICESAVVSYNHKSRGERPLAFVRLVEKVEGAEPYSPEELDTIKKETTDNIRSEVGNYARVCGVIFVESFPKSRNGRIMRDHIK